MVQPEPAMPALWNMLDAVWTNIAHYPAADFEFVQGVNVLSTFKGMATTCLLYYAVISGGRRLMRDREPFRFQMWFKAHNLFLSLFSLALLLLFANELVPSLWRHGFYQNVCGDAGWTDRLLVLYYINYMTKYVELLDTVMLMLMKKPIIFLHFYHHPATVFLCWSQLVGNTSVSWVPICLNLTVHVVMYWYYFQSARGIRVAWKQYITRLQIAQFVIDLAVVYFCTYDYYASRFFPFLPHHGPTCAGKPLAAATGCLILTSYLFLFLAFYASTYRKMAGKKGREAKRASENAVSSVSTAMSTAVESVAAAHRQADKK